MMAESDSRLNVVKSSPDPQILNQFHQQVVLENVLKLVFKVFKFINVLFSA